MSIEKQVEEKKVNVEENKVNVEEKKEVDSTKVVSPKKNEVEEKKVKVKPRAKNEIKRTSKVKELKELVNNKKKLPTFRGRFGNKNVRSIKKDKWSKWSSIHGIDAYHNKEDGKIVSDGFRTPKKFRGLHPSGYEHIVIRNTLELAGVNSDMQAVYISSKVGIKKRKEIVKQAKEKQIRILNR